jgi:hypothetical protein
VIWQRILPNNLSWRVARCFLRGLVPSGWSQTPQYSGRQQGFCPLSSEPTGSSPATTGAKADRQLTLADPFLIFAVAGFYSHMKFTYRRMQNARNTSYSIVPDRMIELESKHRYVYEKFQNDHQVIQQTNQFCLVRSSDLIVIEKHS